MDVSSVLEAGVAGSRYLRLLLKQNEVIVDDALGKLYHLLAELGYFVKRGDKYRRTNKASPPIPSKVLGAIFDDVIVPHLLGEGVRPSHETLFAATAIFQGLRARAASKLGKMPLVLVAGWLPCGFSTEVAAATGADIVILDENWEVLALEEERVSILPLELERVLEPVSPSLFIAFEVGRLEDLALDKYGKFSVAIICHRGVDVKKAREVAEKVYKVRFLGALGLFADLLAEALGLGQVGECAGKIYYKDADLCIMDAT